MVELRLKKRQFFMLCKAKNLERAAQAQILCN